MTAASSLPIWWSAAMVALLLLVAGVERAVEIVEGWRANLRMPA